jgi:hypothetical protein
VACIHSCGVSVCTLRAGIQHIIIYPDIHLFFLSATLVTNYQHLLCKFKLLSKECDDLKSKLESNETKTSDSVDLNESSIPCGILSPR